MFRHLRADGFSFGYTHSNLTAQPVILFGRKDLSTLQSILQGVNSLGFVLGSSVIGIAHDAFGSFSKALHITFVLTVISYVLGLYLATRPEVL